MDLQQYVDQLITNENFLLAEADRARAVFNYLMALSNWLNNSKQAVGKADPGPRPVPPINFTPPADPPSGLDLAVSVQSHTPVVGERDYFGLYPSGDDLPNGTLITWFGKPLRKVVQPSPFGNRRYYVDAV